MTFKNIVPSSKKSQCATVITVVNAVSANNSCLLSDHSETTLRKELLSVKASGTYIYNWSLKVKKAFSYI